MTHSSVSPCMLSLCLAGIPEGYWQKETSELFHPLSREKWKSYYWVKQCLYSWFAMLHLLLNTTALLLNPCALGLQAPEMHKPHLNFTFVHHLPSQDFSPFLDSCIPLWFQQEERTKTTLPHHKRTPCILQQKEGPRCLTSSSSLLSFQFEQEENNNFSFCNSVHTSQKHSSSILTTEPPAFQVQTCVSKAWTETGLKWDCNIHFYLWLLALKHRSIEMSQSHFENSFQRTKLKSGLPCR